MTFGGWFIMLCSVGFVTGLLGWCVGRILRTPGATDHIHPSADLEGHERSEG